MEIKDYSICFFVNGLPKTYHGICHLYIMLCHKLSTVIFQLSNSKFYKKWFTYLYIWFIISYVLNFHRNCILWVTGQMNWLKCSWKVLDKAKHIKFYFLGSHCNLLLSLSLNKKKQRMIIHRLWINLEVFMWLVSLEFDSMWVWYPVGSKQKLKSLYLLFYKI